MSKSKRELSSEEKELWREVAKTVRPRRPLPSSGNDLAAINAKPSAKPPQKPANSPPKPTRKIRSTAAPANRVAEKKVRRGQLEIDSNLDLHGHTQDRAEAALGRFLRSAQARGDRTVIVITGVGRGGEGIIRRRFIDWIGEPSLREVVSGYAPAHRSHGGAGAFYVFLKRRL